MNTLIKNNLNIDGNILTMNGLSATNTSLVFTGVSADNGNLAITGNFSAANYTMGTINDYLRGDKTWQPVTGQITCTFDGAGSVIPAGLKSYVKLEHDALIKSWTLNGDGGVGSIVVDVWSCPYADFPPSFSDSIAASALPTIAEAKTSTSSVLTAWTITQLSADNYIGFNVNSCASFVKATITLKTYK